MRRNLFIRSLVILSLLGLLHTAALGEDTNSGSILSPKSHVVLVRDPSVVSSFSVDAGKAAAMVSAGIKALTGENDDAAAWRHFVSSNDVVGIKINTQSGALQSPRRAVLEAIAIGLRSAGVSATNIYVFDRDPLQMDAAGYRPGRGTNQMQVVSIIDGTGWDANVYFENNLAGRLIWGDLLFGQEGESLSKRSHLPKLVTQTITKLIDVPVLQDHDACGLAGCLYNISVGMVDNMRRFETVGQHGDPMIAEICGMHQLREKLVLSVMDGLIAGYAGGPGFKPQYSWNYGALYFSTDPVAIDSLAVAVLDGKRNGSKISPIGPLATHVTTASRLGLGQSERAKIDLSEIRP
jgi:hypothetical protein